MEDENGLELSLGLCFGGSSAKPKSKNGGTSDDEAEEVGRCGKMVDDFKNFFHADAQKQDLFIGTQISDPKKSGENFFNDLSKAKENNGSVNSNGRGPWAGNSVSPIEIEEDKRLETGRKRNLLFDDINHQKKHGSEVLHTDFLDRARTSHISLTGDGSTAENEDVADSEVVNSTFKPISQHDDGSRQVVRVGNTSSDAPKEVHGVVDSSTADLNGKRRLTSSSEKDFKRANLNYVQLVNMTKYPYPSSVKEPDSVGAPSSQIPGVINAMPPAACEHWEAQPVNSGNLPIMFGFPSVQIPVLDKDNSWDLISQTQQVHATVSGRVPPNSAAVQVISSNISEAMPYDGRPLERTKGDRKQHITEESPSSQAEDVKGSSTNLEPNDVSDPSTREGVFVDFSTIKPGLSADVKFGGCGSYPNLPWVSSRGSGPNGRTISGVTYRSSANHIRIVCACHGSHLSPEEFVLHANEENTNPEGSVGLGTIANGNRAAAAHS